MLTSGKELGLQPREKPGHFEIALDARITDPAAFRVSFVILLDGDLVMSPEHLGVAYMAATLRAAGFSCEIREAEHGRHQEVVDAIAAYAPGLVCFTLMSLNVPSCVEFCAALRKEMPEVVIACGGPAGTFTGTDVLRVNPHADIVAVGEGEPIILDLAQRLALGEDIAGCPGIGYRDEDGGYRQNPARPLVHNLEVLPYPVRDQLIAHGNKLEYVRVSTSRGCVARCTFCSAPNLGNRVQAGKAWRGVGPGYVLDEVEQLVRDHRFRTFDFIDSTFEDPDGGRVGKKRVRAIAEGILDRGLDIYYNVCMRAENWSDCAEDHDLLDLLVRSGLEKVNVGIESGVPEELLLWEKRATVEDNITIIRLLREHGIYLAMGFIPFHPYATVETLTRNADFLREHAGHNLRRLTERLEVYPGTSIARKLADDGLLGDRYEDNLDPYDYRHSDERVERLAVHFASLYNDEDYHKRGVITDQSAVFEFETFNVVVQTFVSRLYRRFHALPGAMEVLERFKDFLHETRQDMGRQNHEFFMENLDDVLTDRLDHAKRRRQLEQIEARFRSCIDRIRAEQLRVGMRLHRFGADVTAISSSLPPVTPGGAPRSYNGGAPTW
ncbi:B12-binding domain-containing radical SAM protein [Streptomyces sp. 4503]|uniref:B12-binding domain-containing radical SAM protein n=1 Tax=Streptomyces niphimycinicus TaxID=2842201 RepID=A0ABS6CRD5_9ACTN|nr:radical SAM protein [Streptomyces niphimycinicus]MBU3869472.1 B12-binding domain-containing radical SAM protein [Streptomyces niphimycinicus]